MVDFGGALVGFGCGRSNAEDAALKGRRYKGWGGDG
jgi:hypothetical protein